MSLRRDLQIPDDVTKCECPLKSVRVGDPGAWTQIRHATRVHHKFLPLKSVFKHRSKKRRQKMWAALPEEIRCKILDTYRSGLRSRMHLRLLHAELKEIFEFANGDASIVVFMLQQLHLRVEHF